MLYIVLFSEFSMMHNGTLSCNEKYGTNQCPVHFNCIAILKGSPNNAVKKGI